MTAVLEPVARGANRTSILQLAPAAKLDPQLVVCTKSGPASSCTVIEPMVSGALLRLVSTTVCAELVLPTICSPKTRAELDSVTAGADVPVPAKATTCGLPPPLSLIIREADRFSAAPGVKIMSMMQLAPAPKLLPHVLVLLWEKSPAFAPTNVIW